MSLEKMLSSTNLAILYCKQESKLLKFLGFMWNPLSWVMEAAAIMAIALANGGVTTLGLYIFVFCQLDFILISVETCRENPQIGRIL